SPPPPASTSGQPPPSLTIPLEPSLDITGQQIVAVEAYQDAARAAFALFDTGSSAITFSASTQAAFTAAGSSIPIAIKGGGIVEGVGGAQVGDVSAAGSIQADGLHAATLSFNNAGQGSFTFSFGSQAVIAPGIQAFVGSPSTSPSVQSIVGTPILASSASTPGGYAAVVEMQGVTFNLSPLAAGLVVTLPDVRFAAPGTTLFPASGTTNPVTIPLTLTGSDNHTNPGNDISESPVPVQSNVSLTSGSVTVANQPFLFDTGAQISVISTALATTLGLNLSQPDFTATVSGDSGPTTLKGYVISSLTLPQSGGGTLTFTNVPVFVFDAGTGLAGILGMNLFNTATAMVYDPFSPAGASFSVSFSTNPNRTPEDPREPGALAALGLSFGSTLIGPTQPVNPPSLGTIAGKVFFDANWNRQLDPREQGIAGTTVYIDMNNDGKFDAGDLSAVSDSSGAYQFTDLEPGQYVVREEVPKGIFVTTPTNDYATVVVTSNSVSTLNFGNQDAVVTQLPGYLEQLYGTVLDRAIDSGGLNFWLGQITAGVSRTAVAQAIWNSPEHLAIEVENDYSAYLGRTASAAEQSYWVNRMLGGMTEDQLVQAIVASPEYLQSQGSDEAFLAMLYTNLLGRSIDVESQVSWENALANGLTRASLVQQVLGSSEFTQNEVDQVYADILHRPADAPGQAYWDQALSQNLTSSDALAIAFLGSDEYYALAVQFIQAPDSGVTSSSVQ
ncbi:MAG TPA: DUF4214 domain-containing protein, partial [Gemmataceae bacterium]|nr:DUF4214 domain-containing protein [Gemmataceae bacterium]